MIFDDCNEAYEGCPLALDPSLPAPRPAELPHLRRGSVELGLHLTEEQIDRFACYRAVLLDWNQRVNLTSITEPSQVETKHFLDSLTVSKAIPSTVRRSQSVQVADIGAGAGFPGIPLALISPAYQVTLIETTRKKCRFLEHVVATLGLENVSVRCGRAEDLARDPELRERFDVVLARAVATLPSLVEIALPFVRLGGRFIAMKKAGIDAEIVGASYAVKALGGRSESPVGVRLPVLNEDRLLVIIAKVRHTSADFPRRAGTPVKFPLVGPFRPAPL